jgi:hypothetical protein
VLGVVVGFLLVAGVALFLNDPDGPTQDLGAVEVDVDGSDETGLADEGLDDPVEILAPDASPSPAALGEAGLCRFLDPVTVRIEGKPLRVSLGPTIVAGLWDGFEVGPLVVVESSLVRLHPPPAFVVAAVVRQDGEEIGVGAWIASDQMALFDPSFGVEQEEFRQEPLAYPHATTVRAANDIAAQASAFESTDSSVAPDAKAVRCARTAGD